MLSIENLVAGYAGKPIVQLPAFALEAGEHCLILGNSGSGKTTLLYALAGMLQPMQGNIRLGDMEMTSLHGAAKDRFRGKHMGFIHQTLHVVDALSAVNNVLLAQYAAGLPQDYSKAMRLLEQLGIAECSERKPHALSQGQRQRLSIARAAINRPSLILGDEPTSALDDEACETVMQLLLESAKASNASLIIATHDIRIKHHFQHHIRLGGMQ